MKQSARLRVISNALRDFVVTCEAYEKVADSPSEDVRKTAQDAMHLAFNLLRRIVESTEKARKRAEAKPIENAARYLSRLWNDGVEGRRGDAFLSYEDAVKLVTEFGATTVSNALGRAISTTSHWHVGDAATSLHSYCRDEVRARSKR